MKKEKQLENSLRLCVFVIGIFSLCILLLTFKLKVNAATVFNGSLPYIVPENTGLNSGIDIDAVLSLFENSFKPNMAQFYPNVDFDHCIMYIVDAPNSNNGNISIYLIPVPVPDITISSDSVYESYNVQSDPIYFRHDSRIFTINTNINTWNYQGSNQYDGRPLLFGNQSTIVRDSGNYTINYPFLLLGYDSLYDSTGDYVIMTNLLPSGPDVFQTGHAIEPNFDTDAIIDSGLTPNHVPVKPTINNYTLTIYNPPAIDTTNLESLVESIFDLIVYHGEYIGRNLVGVVYNLIVNVQSMFDYLGELITYLFNVVVNTIKQTVHNLFENFQSLFEPVLNSFANMINIFNTLYNLGLKDDVFDLPTLFGALFVPNQSDLALLVDTFVEFDYLQTASVSIKSLINGIFDVLNDDAVYSIHLQGFTFHGVTVPQQEISFDWYLPYKATGDIFISAFLIVGYLYWLWTRISGIFHGAVPDSQGSSEITVDHSVSGVGGWFDY